MEVTATNITSPLGRTTEDNYAAVRQGRSALRLCSAGSRGVPFDFCAAIFDYLNKLVSDGYNIVLCGDYNIAHKPIDLANPKANEGNAGYLPEERAWMDFFTANGYVDVFREFCKEEKQYTWWSYRFHAREKDIGWRIDYTCVNKPFLPQVTSAGILKDVLGSDHCPIEIIIKE